MTIAGALLEQPTVAPPLLDRTSRQPDAGDFVSVVIPVKNAAAFIGEAIESALLQGSAVGEIIVVDDGSTDGTVDIVSAINVRRLHLIRNEGTGVSAARNLGARMARGGWLLFLDADDRLRAGAVETLMAEAKVNTDAVLVYGDYDLIDSVGRAIGRRALLKKRSKPSGDVLERLAAGNFIVNGGIMLVRKDAFAAAGGFDESLRFCEDWHCWCRLAALGPFAWVPALLLDYRLHTANTMNAAARTPEDFFPAVQRVFSDRRILSRLAPDRVARLRRSAEIHLITYSATQSVRYARYGRALAYLAMIARKSVPDLPRALTRTLIARFGI